MSAEDLLSPELRAALGGGCDLVLPSKKKKKKNGKKKVKRKRAEMVDPALLRMMKKMNKRQRRKFLRSQERKLEKKDRTEIYDTMKNNAMSTNHLALLGQSGRVGQDLSRKQKLQRDLRLVRAKVEIDEDSELLRRRRDVVVEEEEEEDEDEEVEEEEVMVVDQNENDAKEETIEEENVPTYVGVEIETHRESRCKHYHSKLDVLALESSCCHKFYACVKCHDEMENHKLIPWDSDTSLNRHALLCGVCEKTFSIRTYSKAPENCTHCSAPFNPKCKKHWNMYFSNELLKRAGVINTTTGDKQVEENRPRKFFRLVSRDPEIQAIRMKLPMCGMEQEFMEAVNQNDVVIVCGETGSGKTTQVPQFLYEAGYGDSRSTMPGIVGVTQPRRVAAISTAQRVAVELNTTCDSKGLVGYQIRHQTSGISENTKIKFMTEGVLLQEATHDVLLRKYSCIIIDEAHERNTDTDILLGLLSRVVPLRAKRHRDDEIGRLKLIIMSATLRVEDFTKNTRLFPSPPPVIKVGGRTHPVTVHFSRRTATDEDYLDFTVRKILQIHRRLPAGAVLAFLPGKQEIEYVCKKLREYQSTCAGSGGGFSNSTRKRSLADEKNGLMIGESSSDEDEQLMNKKDFTEEQIEDEEETRVLGPSGDEGTEELKLRAVVDGPLLALALHAQLPKKEQMKVFESPAEGTRLVVVATNVAESSITIPGVRYVVDAGRSRNRVYETGYDGMNTVSKFETSWCTKASADQRAGRAGRTAPGHTYRLYSSAVFDNDFEQFAKPEILINPSALSSVVLRLKRLHIDRVFDFPFPNPPPSRSMKRAVRELTELGLMSRVDDLLNDKDKEGDLTTLGRHAATFPVSPRYGKFLALAAARANLGSSTADMHELSVALVASMNCQNTPFRSLVSAQAALERAQRQQQEEKEEDEAANEKHDDLDDEERERCRLEEARKREMTLRSQLLQQWVHVRSDMLGLLRVLGASTFVTSEQSKTNLTRRRRRRRTSLLVEWCEEQRLTPKVLREMVQLRDQLRKQLRLRSFVSNNWWASSAPPVAPILKPPSRRDEQTLLQLLTASFLDRVAKRVDGEYGAAYQSCDETVREHLYVHSNSFVTPRGSRGRKNSIGVDAQYVVYKDLIRSTGRRSVIVMRGVTVINPRWLPKLASNTPMLHNSGPLDEPPPSFDLKRDRLRCYVAYQYGPHRWSLPLQLEDFPCSSPKRYTWFARLLLEGSIVPAFRNLRPYYRCQPREMTMSSGGSSAKRVLSVLSPLRDADVVTCTKLASIWRTNPKFLQSAIRHWLKKSERHRLDSFWSLLLDWSQSYV